MRQKNRRRYHQTGSQIRRVVFKSWWFLWQLLRKKMHLWSILCSFKSDHHYMGKHLQPNLCQRRTAVLTMVHENLTVLHITALLWKYDNTHMILIFFILKDMHAKGKQWEISSLESAFLECSVLWRCSCNYILCLELKMYNKWKKITTEKYTYCAIFAFPNILALYLTTFTLSDSDRRAQ